LSHGLSFFQEGKGGGKDTLKLEAEGEESIGSKPDNKNEALPSAKKGGENPSSSKAPVSPFVVLFRDRESETFEIQINEYSSSLKCQYPLKFCTRSN